LASYRIAEVFLEQILRVNTYSYTWEGLTVSPGEVPSRVGRYKKTKAQRGNPPRSLVLAIALSFAMPRASSAQLGSTYISTTIWLLLFLSRMYRTYETCRLLSPPSPPPYQSRSCESFASYRYPPGQQQVW